MEHLKYIKGMDSVIQEIPAQYRYLPLFGNILKLEYLKEFDYEEWTDIYNIRLLVADEAELYKIQIFMKYPNWIFTPSEQFRLIKFIPRCRIATIPYK